MPWLETAPMEHRERFIRDHRLALYTMAELSARYGISRKTGYKWLDRFDQGGREGLGDRSRDAAVSAQNIRRGGDADLRGPSAAPELGAGQAPGLAQPPPSDGRSPGRQHGGGPLGAQGAGQETPPASPLPASGRGADQDRPPQ